MIGRLAYEVMRELREELAEFSDDAFPPVVVAKVEEDDLPREVTIFSDWPQRSAQDRADGMVGFLRLQGGDRAMFYTTMNYVRRPVSELLAATSEDELARLREKLHKEASQGQQAHIVVWGSKSGGTRVWICDKDPLVRENWERVSNVWNEVVVAFFAVYGAPTAVS